MSEGGDIDEEFGFNVDSDVISPLKSSNKSSSIERKHGSFGCADQRSSSSSPLLDIAQALPAEDISICPYCSNNYRKPRVLDCLHSMCEDCVIAQLDGRNERKFSQKRGVKLILNLKNWSNQKQCDQLSCQESHVGNDVRFVNFMLLDFIRLRSTDNSEWNKCDLNNRICRACKGEQQAVANCRHCCSELCKNCVQAHADMKLFSGHQVVLFSETKSGATKGIAGRIGSMPFASGHYEQFCTNCDEIICKHCTAEHRDHICAPLNDTFYQFCRWKLHVSSISNKKGNCTAEARSAIPERLNELTTVYDRCHAKVTNAFQVLTEAVEDLKQQVLCDLDKKRDEQEEFYNNLYQKIDLKIGMMQDALGFTNRLLDKGTKVELCASRKKIYQQLLMLHRSMPNVNMEFEMDFATPTKTELIKKLEAVIGNVHCRVSAAASKDSKGLLEPTNTVSNGPHYRIFRGCEPCLNASQALNIHTGAGQPSNYATNTATTAAAGPGTIGMERRQNRGANYTAFPPTLNQNSAEIFNLARLNLDGSVPLNHRAIPATNSFNSLEASSSMNDAFSQTKIWNAAFAGQMNVEGTMPKPKIYDTRFGEFSTSSDTAFNRVPANPRTSQCNTPAFENVSISGFGDRIVAPPTINGSTIEMSLHTMFGSSGLESLNTPQGLTLGLEDEIAIADTNNHRCVIVNANGKFLRQLGSSGTEEGCLYFPRKVVSLVRARECRYVVLDRGPTQLFNRLQLFSNNGDFICRLVTTPYHVEQISVMAVNKSCDQLIVIDNKYNVIAFSVETIPQIQAIHAFNITGFVHEASDIAVYKDSYYITDYKTHSIVVYSLYGTFVRKFGNNFLTPYPIGIDISKSGDILVGDSHGNHFHIVVFNAQGVPQQDYKCLATKVSRCTGLKISAEGLVITMSRQNSSVLVFNTLYMPSA
uniref:B box-type domain-containing protein n=1 Tax=Ditylenchus dipsaci TaxID=166011 RepID=A0A915D3X6_9BILA